MKKTNFLLFIYYITYIIYFQANNNIYKLNESSATEKWHSLHFKIKYLIKIKSRLTKKIKTHVGLASAVVHPLTAFPAKLGKSDLTSSPVCFVTLPTNVSTHGKNKLHMIMLLSLIGRIYSANEYHIPRH